MRSGFHLHSKQTLDFKVSLEQSWSDVLADFEGKYSLRWRIIYALKLFYYYLYNYLIQTCGGRFWVERGRGGGGKAATKLVACNDMYPSLCITKKGNLYV